MDAGILLLAENEKLYTLTLAMWAMSRYPHADASTTQGSVGALTPPRFFGGNPPRCTEMTLIPKDLFVALAPSAHPYSHPRHHFSAPLHSATSPY